MRLTDRTTASAVTKNDYIHVVITGDTSQSPEGSSYKAQIGQVLELYNLPVPNVKLMGSYYGSGYSASTLNSDNTVGPDIVIVNPPFITVDNLTQEQLDNNVFIEMVQYKTRKKTKTFSGYGVDKFTGGRYVVQPRIEDDGFGNPINELQKRIWDYYGKTITDRGGSQTFSDGLPLAVNRSNHYQPSTVNEVVDLSGYFAGRFTYNNLYYIDENGNPNVISDLPVPTTNRCTNYKSNAIAYSSIRSKTKPSVTSPGSGYKMCYNGNLTYLYIAFRYIMFDPFSNNGNGSFVSGPLSPIIKVTNRYYPVLKTSIEGRCIANPMLGSVQKPEIICSFIDKPR